MDWRFCINCGETVYPGMPWCQSHSATMFRIKQVINSLRVRLVLSGGSSQDE